VVVLGLRLLILGVFLAGLLDSFKHSSGKIVFFFRKLGLVGCVYFLCWPATVLAVEFALPTDLHRLVISLIEELVHIYACSTLCYMLTEPESAYCRVSLQDDDNPLKLNDYKNR
jgi:hypothetical protein